MRGGRGRVRFPAGSGALFRPRVDGRGGDFSHRGRALRATEERANQRDGVRHRTWDTGVGTIDLAIPKLRTGSEASLRKLTETHAEAELELATT